MFSTAELDYIKALINSYSASGYKYYLCHTITESNNDNDFCIYFSKEEIKANNHNSFSVKDALIIYVDSSNYYNTTNSKVQFVNYYTGDVNISVKEYIYTNAKVTFEYTSYALNPDISINYNYNHLSMISICIVTILFLYIVISDLFNIGRR